VVNGLGIPALTSVPSTMKWYDKTAPKYAIKYNPTDAQKVLSAHHVTGPYTFLTSKTPTGAATAELIQAELGQVGVKVNIVQNTDQFVTMSEKGQFDMELGGWTYTDPDILFDFFHSSQESNGGYNFGFLKGAPAKTLDSYIIAGRTTVDEAKAKAAYAAAQKFMDQQAIIDPLWTDENIDAYTTKVHGLRNNFYSGGEPITPMWQDLWLSK
jgi:peptide/nickel transport system substrate-binding protein